LYSFIPQTGIKFAIIRGSNGDITFRRLASPIASRDENASGENDQIAWHEELMEMTKSAGAKRVTCAGCSRERERERERGREGATSNSLAILLRRWNPNAEFVGGDEG